jgi:Prokaryotic E2 family E
MIPIILVNEIAELLKLSYQIETEIVANRIYIIFKDFLLPDGFNIKKTDLLVWTGINYPSCAFDMFWVNKDLLLFGGAIPKSAQSIEIHLNKKWRRFSIHPYNYKPWNPSVDSLNGFLSYINKRLNQPI